ncbi:hypothetical protein NW754_001206 [Fusarium falciforme]|uniref:Uncharacterized protein n=1 Tax=Fusarium falciforme TaxID=195108 RepID=A0A9W8V3X6_9HYPO|nr:hypothetical protein NW754_001206 [Fusarium falciforme]KAJ4192878.1 hypothetical protein NW755_004028 [Fusarium falciforme]KAJ4210341.1 hypothetical protein NW767_000609 [Fusarium falciforme]KAJ4253151.1 hypothetical protein NW757_005860 [Fusarium falciforme]
MKFFVVSTESLEREAFANGAGYGAQRVGAFGIHYMDNTSGRFPAQDMRRIVFKESDGLQTWQVCISFSPLGAENGYTKLWDGTATPFDARKLPIPTTWRMHL